MPLVTKHVSRVSLLFHVFSPGLFSCLLYLALPCYSCLVLSYTRVFYVFCADLLCMAMGEKTFPCMGNDGTRHKRGS